MREDAAAQEALLIDFNAMEAAKTIPGGPGGSGGSHGPPIMGWVPPTAGFSGPEMHMGEPAGAYSMGPPPPYGYPVFHDPRMLPPGPATAPFDYPNQQTKLNIPPNNLGNVSTSSNETSPKNGNGDNLQVISIIS